MDDKKLLESLRYVRAEECGYMRELAENVGEECVCLLLAVGFISSGCNPSEKTWHVTELGKEFYEEVKPAGARASLKFSLGYVCRYRYGNLPDLEKEIDPVAVREFGWVGFIKVSGSKWKKTDFADRYYRDFFGWWSYAKIFFSSWLSRFFSLSLQKHPTMKRLIPILVICTMLGCRETEVDYDSRGAQEEPADSASVTPSFTVPEWGDSINVDF